MSHEAPQFTGGSNIALKIPKFRFEETLKFYRHTLRLPYLGEHQGTHVFQFGPMRLWLDRVETYSQADVWLELHTDDPDQAADYLADLGTPIRDEIEPLEIPGHWISDPAGIIHLISRVDD